MNKETCNSAIIIAAGLGSRLGGLTEDIPKCLLEVGGVRILDRQLAAYRAHGVTDIALVRGYKAGRIDLPGITYYLNDNYNNNNILASLMYAEPHMDRAFMASYSDIVFAESVVEKLAQAPGDISLVVDTAWQQSYEGREGHPTSEAEKVMFDASGNVTRIGKDLEEAEQADGEFIGLIKFSQAGAALLKSSYEAARAAFAGKPFGAAAVFEKAYITDIIRYMIEAGHPISSVNIQGDWREIDTEEDLDRANETL